MKIFILIVNLIPLIYAEAQVVRQPVSVLYPALGAYSKNFSDIFSGTSNQASLATLKTAAFAVYGERRFMLDELNTYTTIIAIPTTSGTVGFQADYFGSSSFNESRIGVIYGRKITSAIDVGVKFNYLLVKVAGYGAAAAVNFEAGAIFHLTDRLHAGFHVYNPASSKLGKNGTDQLASAYCFGIGYEASESLFVCTEIVKREAKPVSVNAALQYNLHKKVFIRCGISADNNISFGSVGLNIGFGRIDVNTAYHPQLGFTPGLLLLINFKKQTDE